MEKIFKKICSWSMMAVLGCGLTFTACGDDDEPGGGNFKQATAQVEGNKANFKYAYYYVETEGNRQEVELNIYTIDFLAAMRNPGSVKKGTLFSSAYIDINLPSPEMTTDYELDLDFNLDLYEVLEDSYDGELHGDSYVWFTNDWTEKNQTPIKAVKNGDYFLIEAANVKMLACDEDHSIDHNSRKTTGSFFFEGNALNTTNMFEEVASARGIKAVQVDKETMNMLKSYRRR